MAWRDVACVTRRGVVNFFLPAECFGRVSCVALEAVDFSPLVTLKQILICIWTTCICTSSFLFVFSFVFLFAFSFVYFVYLWLESETAGMLQE